MSKINWKETLKPFNVTTAENLTIINFLSLLLIMAWFSVSLALTLPPKTEKQKD